MDKTYNIRCGVPLMLDHEYAHCATTIRFTGFDQEHDGSTVYLLLGKPLNLKLPLTDGELVVTSEITPRAGAVKAQLQECQLDSMSGEYEYNRYSDIFTIVISPSLSNG